jgi:Fic family protein
MIIPPKYSLTEKISELLSSIEGSREVIESLTVDPKIELNIRRESTLKSSLYSARIEGNPLTLDELAGRASKDQKRIEIYNILKAINWIKDKTGRNTNKNDILTLHKIVMSDLSDSESLGRFRNNMEAIFNSAGAVVYMPPPINSIDQLISELVKYINSPKERSTPIRAVIAHFIFEKIHPFLDGNGRVGRLIIQKVLFQRGYGMKGFVSLEEYFNDHRSEYYRLLEESEKDVTNYIEFMLEAISKQARKSKELLISKQKPEIEDFLLPRRAEILRIIKDHKIVNFDQIRRRFRKVNERTLRYDLKKLQDQNFVRKLGTTKGAYYAVNH